MKTPQTCLICGARWSGGHQIPGMEMKEGLRVFFECGASMSYKCIDGVYQILFKNCPEDGLEPLIFER